MKKTKWHSLIIQRENVVREGKKDILIRIPEGRYQGKVFWHLKKLVREGEQANTVSIAFTDEFKFHLRSYKDENYDVCDSDEIVVSAEELIQQIKG